MGIKNLRFHVGSAANFPGLGSESYDIVFANHVLHWIPDKQEAFKNTFSSLKPDGKIALHFVDRVPSVMDHAFRAAGFFYRSQVTGYRSQVTGYRSQVTGHRLQVTGHRFKKITFGGYVL